MARSMADLSAASQNFPCFLRSYLQMKGGKKFALGLEFYLLCLTLKHGEVRISSSEALSTDLKVDPKLLPVAYMNTLLSYE